MHNGSKKKKRTYDKTKSNNSYLKQQNSILRCLSRLKFENSLISNMFFSFIFCGDMILDKVEKDQIKYFAQSVKCQNVFFSVQTAA